METSSPSAGNISKDAACSKNSQDSQEKPTKANSTTTKRVKKGLHCDRRDKTPIQIQRKKVRINLSNKKLNSSPDKNRTKFQELSDEASASKDVANQLTLAVTEQEKIVKMVTENLGQNSHSPPDTFREFCNVELDEIFYVWINLFYFIISLKVHLFEEVKKREVKPNLAAERDIILQALECAKIFSIFKIKRLTETLKNVRSDQSPPEMKEATEGEEKPVASRFIAEMTYMADKTKELINYIQKKATET